MRRPSRLIAVWLFTTLVVASFTTYYIAMTPRSRANSATASVANRPRPLPVVDPDAPAARAPEYVRRAIRQASFGEFRLPRPDGGYDVCMEYHGLWRYNAREQKAGHTFYHHDNRKFRTLDYVERLRREGARTIYLVSCNTGNQPFVEIDLRTGRTVPWPDWVVHETRRGKSTRTTFVGAARRTERFLKTEEHIRDLRVLRGVSQAKGNRLLDVSRPY